MEDGVRKAKKNYSNSFRSLQAIWQVLRQYASPEHPLTVGKICEYLKEMVSEDNRPSPDTVARILPQAKELMDQLFPLRTVREGEMSHADARQDGDGLHIVLETPAGEVLRRGGMDIEATQEPFKPPSYATVEKMLSQGVLLDLDTFPFRLRCVARIPEKGGQVRMIPYEEWEEELDREPGKTNNLARRYYLHSDLSEAEWRLFSDLILVYPFISEEQTEHFLIALNKLRPKRTIIPERYAYKRSNPEMMEIINCLDEAIAQKRMVRIVYGEYRLEQEDSGNWKPVLRQRRKTGELEVAPYALMWSNGNYYLIALDRGMMNLRADRILEVTMLNRDFTPPDDFDPASYRNRCPVMYPGKERFVRLRCRVSLLNTILDFFGDVPQYTTPKTDADGVETTEITMSIAPAGVKLFALQYAGSVEVLDPPELREEVARELEAAAKKYRS